MMAPKINAVSALDLFINIGHMLLMGFAVHLSFVAVHLHFVEVIILIKHPGVNVYSRGDSKAEGIVNKNGAEHSPNREFSTFLNSEAKWAETFEINIGHPSQNENYTRNRNDITTVLQRSVCKWRIACRHLSIRLQLFGVCQ